MKTQTALSAILRRWGPLAGVPTPGRRVHRATGAASGLNQPARSHRWVGRSADWWDNRLPGGSKNLVKEAGT